MTRAYPCSHHVAFTREQQRHVRPSCVQTDEQLHRKPETVCVCVFGPKPLFAGLIPPEPTLHTSLDRPHAHSINTPRHSSKRNDPRAPKARRTLEPPSPDIDCTAVQVSEVPRRGYFYCTSIPLSVQSVYKYIQRTAPWYLLNP